ncbi:LysR family transcriptional regulator [Paenibacillus sp. GD4]|uniref:LysR family transcriptional regulator n=1 Tax=Paenibacillus sp. GD4 TaxID=3068890 RepID=UPI002796B5B3|nr:LysR family transcriptional regulator [Paenibacillus sp. GD4]MDQ1910810.1 LysR family transcriptional regulator [Paenibacillus sp. GD4]
MDLKTVKTFQMIVKYGSFHRAAEEMNYVQSTVTMQIQKLESELGVTLLERGKKIRLTEAGRLFYEQSLPIVKQMEQLQTNMSDLLLGESGNIRLGVTEPTASYRLPCILKKFMAQYPNIRISLEFGNTPGLTARLLQGELDLALGSAPELGSEIYFEPLFQEEFVLLMPEDHPLASLPVIVPENLRDARLLITSEACPYRRKLEMVLQEAGNIPIDTMEIGSMIALKFYVESGLGIALVPKIMVEPVPAGTTIRALSGSLISMNFGILSKPLEYPTHQAGSKLYQYLKQELLA